MLNLIESKFYASGILYISATSLLSFSKTLKRNISYNKTDYRNIFILFPLLYLVTRMKVFIGKLIYSIIFPFAPNDFQRTIIFYIQAIYIIIVDIPKISSVCIVLALLF